MERPCEYAKLTEEKKLFDDYDSVRRYNIRGQTDWKKELT